VGINHKLDLFSGKLLDLSYLFGIYLADALSGSTPQHVHKLVVIPLSG
jgi:hypothetical protein